MFRPSDKALVRGTDQLVTVFRVSKEPGTTTMFGRTVRVPHPIETSIGVFNESDLQMAHPSCLPTMTGKNLEAEFMQARYAEEAKRESLTYEKRKEFEEVLRRMPLDLNGHFEEEPEATEEPEGRLSFKDRLFGYLFLSLRLMDEEVSEKILSGKLTEVYKFSDLLCSGNCPKCGEDTSEIGIETDGKTLRFSGPRCPYENGFPVTEWELNVPSGKLVVANDLRALFPLPEGDGEIESVNTTLGCNQTTQAYAAIGMSHASVGNSCPSIYKIPPKAGGGYAVATGGVGRGAKRLAGICTDLWWYSMCDKNEFDRRCEKFSDQIVQKARKRKRKNSTIPETSSDPVKVALEHWNCEVIDIPPGVYKFYHDYNVDRNEYRVVYARFEKIREPDPVKDLLSSWEAVIVNPHAYVQAQVRNWPTLYGYSRNKREAKPWELFSEEEKNSSWQRIADHVFCVIGGGTDWHEKGFPQCRVDPTIEDSPPPKLRAQYHWYPFSEGYGGLSFKQNLSPAFARWAFEVLESIISFGMNVRYGERCREVKETRERMLRAVRKYRKLAELHPGVADPEYLAWVTEPGRAEAWVKSFDLGPVVTPDHIGRIERQKWIPEDAYAIEFDARKLPSGHFSWHPSVMGGCWARKEDAQRYALNFHQSNGKKGGDDCFWSCHAPTSVPLYTVARIAARGDVSHTGNVIVGLEFDYGTDWMKNRTVRKGVEEHGERAGIRVLSKEEYEALLPEAERFYAEAEALARKEKKSA